MTGFTYRNGQHLSDAEVQDISSFYSRFSERDRDKFVDQLRLQPDIFLYRDRGGALRAFGCVEVIEMPHDGQTYGLLYTKWAAVDPAFRGQRLLHVQGLRALLRFRLIHPTTPVYWYLWTSSYKSYLVLARNFVDRWPPHSEPWPPLEAALLRKALLHHGVRDYDPLTGLIRRDGATRYVDHVGNDPALLQDPDAAFYAAINPNQAGGDTVACLARLDARNVAYLAGRVVTGVVQRLRRRRGAASSPDSSNPTDGLASAH